MGKRTRKERMPQPKYLSAPPPHSVFVKNLKEGLWTELPLEGWRDLFFLTLNRLAKRNLRLAELLCEEARSLARVWASRLGDDPKKDLHMLAIYLEKLARRDLSRGKLKPRPDPSAVRLLAVYEDLCDRLRGIKTTLREAKKRRKKPSEGFWRDHRETILRTLGERGRKTTVTPTLAEEVSDASPGWPP